MPEKNLESHSISCDQAIPETGYSCSIIKAYIKFALYSKKKKKKTTALQNSILHILCFVEKSNCAFLKYGVERGIGRFSEFI